MSYNNRMQKRKNKKRFRFILISAIIIYLIFRSVPSLLANNAKTINPEKSTFVNKYAYQGFLIMDETLVKASKSGKVQLFSEEGERVPAGVKIASVNSLNDASSLKQELSQLEESIVALKKTETESKLLEVEKGKIEILHVDLVDKLQELIILGNYDEIYIVKEQLALIGSKSKDISFSNTLVGQSIENLELKMDSINSEIVSNNTIYYSSQAGIISYRLDGYEDVYLPKDFENYIYDKLIKDMSREKNDEDFNVSAGQPIYKNIDNFQWYLAIKIEDLSEIEGYDVNKYINIQMNEDSQVIRGKVIAINTSEDKGVLVAQFDSVLHDNYLIRFPEIEIIKSKTDGYKIPSEVIVDRDSVKGVYIKDKSSIVRFRPINIIGEENNYTYVDMGDNYGNIKLPGEEGSFSTISLFDEIFLKVNNIKEGQILN